MTRYLASDPEIEVAYVRRNGRVICTILLALQENGLFTVYRPTWDVTPPSVEDTVLCRDEERHDAQRYAEQYMAGFATGYDEGVEHGRKS